VDQPHPLTHLPWLSHPPIFDFPFLNPAMETRRKNTFFILLCMAALFFVLFIFPNSTGARDANMLSIFEVDEFAQYPHAVGLLMPGPTLYQSIRNFFVYEHYFYGYPFYFFSALVMLPVKLAAGQNWTQLTTLVVTLLREMINVLPMLAALLMLVYLQTRFRSRGRSILLFLFLLFIPAAVVNDLWWHPDSLVFLFIVLTFFFLDRDGLRFGRNFYAGAAACGLAIGTKHLGVFFVLAIPTYLAWGVIARRITWPKAVLHGAGFVAVMVAALLASNPLLLLPQERAAIIATQNWQFEQTSTGILLTNTAPYFQWGSYPADFRIHYGELVFVLLGFAGLAAGIWRKESRRLNVLILAWILPLTYVITVMATRRTHYFLPVMLPLYSSLVHLFPIPEARLVSRKQALISVGLHWAAAALILVQAVLFLGKDIDLYRTQLQREGTSESIAFAKQVEDVALPLLPERGVAVYRDWGAYFPDRPGWRVELNWDLPTYAYLQDYNPDLLLVETQNVKQFGSAGVVNEAVNPEHMGEVQAFYQDVANNTVKGFHIVYQDAFGYALIKDR
jgi:hypothetical protein